MTGVLLCGLPACVTPGAPRRPLEKEVEAVARPLLEMHPDANWTACYNRLLELGPASVEYLVSRPVMQRTAAPDDLRVMLHTSLLRLLADPAGAPRLSVNCFESTLDLLHFDPKVGGQQLGEVHLPTRRLPAAWPDLYPADFDHGIAQQIDVEGDRQAMLRWWQARRGRPPRSLRRRPLRPRAEYLWGLLSRRYADMWVYALKPDVLLCTYPPRGAALFRASTCEYNLVRAACIWLGCAETLGIQRELIELVAHRSPIVAHNACFALAHSRDPRIREVLERYDQPEGTAPPAARTGRVARVPLKQFQKKSGATGGLSARVRRALAGKLPVAPTRDFLKPL